MIFFYIALELETVLWNVSLLLWVCFVEGCSNLAAATDHVASLKSHTNYTEVDDVTQYYPK